MQLFSRLFQRLLALSLVFLCLLAGAAGAAPSPAMSAWYLKESHLEDDQHTWHTDPRVNPYLAKPYDWITSATAAGAGLGAPRHSRKLARVQLMHRRDLLGKRRNAGSRAGNGFLFPFAAESLSDP